MKKFLLIACSLGCLGIGSKGDSANEILPKQFKEQGWRSLVEELFIPYGYDENDYVEVILQMNLSEQCLREVSTEVHWSADSRKVFLELSSAGLSEACRLAGGKSLLILNLGKVVKGHYEVELVGDAPKVASFHVLSATQSSADTFIYPKILSARVSRLGSDGRIFIRIEAEHPLEGVCTLIRDVRTYLEPQNVLVVVPVLELTERSGACGKRFFQLHVEVEEPVAKGTLLHIRSSGSQSYNLIIGW